MNRGGSRPNSGRKRGSGKWGEPTRPLRIPLSRIDDVLALLQSSPSEYVIQSISDFYWRPLYTQESITARSPLSDTAEKFNLNAYLTPHPERMIFVRAPDKAMIGAGIDKGDMLLIDTRRPVINGCLIAAVMNDELLIRQLLRDNNEQFLVAPTPLYPPLHLTGDIHFTLLGVVTASIHDFTADYF